MGNGANFWVRVLATLCECVVCPSAEDHGKVPELSHVESLEDLTLVGGTVTVKRKRDVLLAVVLVGESETSADGDLGTDDTVATVEAGGEHVHRTTLAVGNTLAAAEKLTNDGLDGSTAHHGETVATVGSDDLVLLGDTVLDTASDGLLTGGQMAETTDLLLLVKTVGGHFHAAAKQNTLAHDTLVVLQMRVPSSIVSHARPAALSLLFLKVGDHIPRGDHVVVHLLQLLLGGVELV